MSKINTSDEKLLWGPLYENVLQIIGTGGVIIPLGDTVHENSGRTTCTSVGDIAGVFTYSEAVTAFDVPPVTLGPARIPLVEFNGTDEEAQGTDAAFWTVDDNAGANGFSMGAWLIVDDTAASRAILSKHRVQATAAREWRWTIASDDTMLMEIVDESVQVTVNRQSDSAITQGSIRFFSLMYDGTGGTTAADGITLYDQGAVLASTASNSGSYVGMENTVALPIVGNIEGTANVRWFNGKMVGGPLGPFWTTKQLTVDEMLRLYQMGRAALGV